MKKNLLLFLFAFLTCASLHAQLIINEVLYDPSNTALEGDANGDGLYDQTKDEFIEFVNMGNSPLNISGYQIWDDTLIGSLVYVFPIGTIVQPRASLVVFGGGTPIGFFGGATVLADTGLSGLSLANTGEIITIKNDLGITLLTFNSDALSNNPNESYTRNPDLTGSFVQHNSINTKKFSPGTKTDGTNFVTLATKLVTFKVDLNKYNGTFDSVFVVGNFNQHCNSCNPMLDGNKDGLYEVSIPILKDTLEYVFKLKSGSSFLQEQFLTVEACTQLSGSTITRHLILKGDSTLKSACFESCSSCANHLSLIGVTDFITPLLGASGKSVFVIADTLIPNLGIYGLGIANNGGGTNGQEYRFPEITVSKGSKILVVRDSAALAAYMSSCWSNFNVVLVDTVGVINHNGNDAVELFKVGEVVETFGDINQNGIGQPWEYTGSWAFKNSQETWVFGGINCTDSSSTILNAKCIFPICALIKATSIEVTSQGNASTITQNGGTLQMIANVFPQTAEIKAVSWSVNDEDIAVISSDGLLKALADGTVIVTATAIDTAGVKGTKSITITGQTSGLSEPQKTHIKLYPNPVMDVLYIQSNHAASNFNVYSIHGKLIQSGKFESNQVDLSALEMGLYLLDVKINEEWIRYKIIKSNIAQ